MNWNNGLDLDDIDYLPRKLLWHLHTAHPTAVFRLSSSGNGFHVISKDPLCQICLEFSDPHYAELRRQHKPLILFSSKKKGLKTKNAGAWLKISEFFP